jgi:hypothetical protein
MFGAARIHPNTRAVIPRMPEPMIKHDGPHKNDGERHAAKRFVATLRQEHPHLPCIVTAERLRSNAPHIATLQAHALHALLGIKEGDHAFLLQQMQAAEHAGRGTYSARHDRAAGLVHRLRLLNDLPLQASSAAVRVNGIEYGERGGEKVQHFSWVTDFRVSPRNVYRRMRGGRARWKIANETFHTLKNQGDHFEHNDGHGTQPLSVVFALVMLLAFVVDQTQQRCCALLQAVWAKLGSKRLLGERMRAVCYVYALQSMRQLFEALLYGLKKAAPVFAVDSSSSRCRVPLQLCPLAAGDHSSRGESYASTTSGGCVEPHSLTCQPAKVPPAKDTDGRNAEQALRCQRAHRTHRP